MIKYYVDHEKLAGKWKENIVKLLNKKEWAMCSYLFLQINDSGGLHQTKIYVCNSRFISHNYYKIRKCLSATNAFTTC